MAIERRLLTHRTQWAAQFAVASELCKRGYEVAFTMGNHPSVDIMVSSRSGDQFGIDVKGLYKRNFWVVKPKAARAALFYVLAYVPTGEANRFFILDQTQANAEIAANDARSVARAALRGKVITTDSFQGIPWAAADADEYREAWWTLPGSSETRPAG